ncbi:MAG: TIR domain-containing protein [Bacilli bacterium]|nr:TIR domain-containing protein [Bacilli bacterium]
MNKSADALLELAEKGDAQAMLELGDCFVEGEGVEQSLEDAANWYQKAADNGLKEAEEKAAKCYLALAREGDPLYMFNIGLCYCNGEGVEQSYEKGAEWYKKAADLGNAGAMNNLGLLYRHGQGVKASARQAAIWFKKAAENDNPNGFTNLGLLYEEVGDLEEAFRQYSLGAEGGDANAMFKVGYLYYHGIGVEQSFEKAFEWYSKGAELGNTAAMWGLGVCYQYGKCVEQSDEKAFKWYEQSAEGGDPDGQCKTGIFLTNGWGTEADPEKAFEYFQSAAEADNPDAMCHVGDCYYNGEGVEQSYEEAVRWYEKAAEVGNEDGEWGLGLCYERGKGVEQSYEEAFAHYLKAAEHGDERAMFKVGYLYHGGKGVKESLEEAAKWYRKGAELGDSSAAWGLGVCYEYGDGVEQSDEKAFEWYERAAEGGDADAMARIAYFYQKGRGVEQSDEQAYLWYLNAAEEGLEEAMCDVGECYENGRGVEQSWEKAAEWYEKSANAGSAWGQLFLGYCYEDGQGVPKSEEKALELYRLAAEQGNANAMARVGEYYERGGIVEQSYEKAAEWYRKAAGKGNARAMLSLAALYDGGQGVEQSDEKAFEWCQKSAEAGNEDAMSVLGSYYYEGHGGVEKSYKKSAEWYGKAEENGSDYAYYGLGTLYAKGLGVPRNPQLALEYFEKAIEAGITEAEEGRNELLAALEQERGQTKADTFEMAKDTDVFVSWYHEDATFKDALVNRLEEEGLRVYDSDRKAKGPLDETIKNAINSAECFVIILTEEAIRKSNYMANEIEWIFQRIKEENLSTKMIKIYTGSTASALEKAIKERGDDRGFGLLSNLSKDFGHDLSSSVENTVRFAKECIRDFALLNYRRNLGRRYVVFPMALSDIITKNAGSEVNGTLPFATGYLNREIVDTRDPSKAYGPEDVLRSKAFFIHGDGGSGKSLYLKNLVRLYSGDGDLFFLLPCSEIKKELDQQNGGTNFLNALERICFRHDPKCLRLMNSSLHNVFFDNLDLPIHIIFDALDEAGNAEEKKKILEAAFDALPNEKTIHYLFTSRSQDDETLIANILGDAPISATVSPVSDAQIMELFDAFYARNFSGQKGTRAPSVPNDPEKPRPTNAEPTLQSSERRSLVNRDAFEEHLALLPEDIKRNPLLVSNLIYIYFATRELRTERAYVLERSTEILVDYLENERGTITALAKPLREMGIKLGSLLAFIAWFTSVNEAATLESTVELFLGEKANEEATKTVCHGLRGRRLIRGDDFSHNIYRAYFAARYIYDNVLERTANKFFEIELRFKPSGKEDLKEYVHRFLRREDGLWPEIALDFVCKLDYELNDLLSGQPLKEDSTSGNAFAFVLDALLQPEGIGGAAYAKLEEAVQQPGLLHYANFIRKYLRRNK